MDGHFINPHRDGGLQSNRLGTTSCSGRSPSRLLINNKTNNPMAKLGDIFKGSYLKADDLQGKTVRLLVERAEVVDFDDGAKVVLHFVSKEKGMVCNKTNCSVMQEITGSDDTDDWAGAQVTLAVRKVEFQGKLVPALRILLPDQPRAIKRPAPIAPPQPKPAPLTDPPVQNEDDVPF